MSLPLKYPVVEIFESLQGEGCHTGKRVVFLRFGGCNLACPWCDTDYDTYERLSGEEVLLRIASFGTKAVILTGGEPLIQEGLEPLLTALKAAGYWIGVETNGLVVPPEPVRKHLDFVAVSPKAAYPELYEGNRILQRADEVRIVVDGDVQAFCARMRDRIAAPRYFLSPCERDGAFNVAETVRMLGELNRGRETGLWRLSFQTHKLGGFR